MKKVLTALLALCFMGMAGCGHPIPPAGAQVAEGSSQTEQPAGSGTARTDSGLVDEILLERDLPEILKYSFEETAPKLHVKAGGEELDYSGRLQSWNGATDAAVCYGSWFPSAVREDSGVRIPTVPMGTDISVSFENNAPDTVEFVGYALDETGEYAGDWSGEDIPASVQGSTLTFSLQPHHPSRLYDGVDWNTEPPLRGFDLECEWDNGNRCTYYFILRTEADGSIAEGPRALRIRSGDQEIPNVAQVERWDGENMAYQFPPYEFLLRRQTASLPKLGPDASLEFYLDGPAPVDVYMQLDALDETGTVIDGCSTSFWPDDPKQGLSFEDGKAVLPLTALELDGDSPRRGFQARLIWGGMEQPRMVTYTFVLELDKK